MPPPKATKKLTNLPAEVLGHITSFVTSRNSAKVRQVSKSLNVAGLAGLKSMHFDLNSQEFASHFPMTKNNTLSIVKVSQYFKKFEHLEAVTIHAKGHEYMRPLRMMVECLPVTISTLEINVEAAYPPTTTDYIDLGVETGLREAWLPKLHTLKACLITNHRNIACDVLNEKFEKSLRIVWLECLRGCFYTFTERPSAPLGNIEDIRVYHCMKFDDMRAGFMNTSTLKQMTVANGSGAEDEVLRKLIGKQVFPKFEKLVYNGYIMDLKGAWIGKSLPALRELDICMDCSMHGGEVSTVDLRLKKLETLTVRAGDEVIDLDINVKDMPLLKTFSIKSKALCG